MVPDVSKIEDRVTIITLRVPWDSENEDHPAGWGWDLLLNRYSQVDVISFEEEMEEGQQDQG